MCEGLGHRCVERGDCGDMLKVMVNHYCLCVDVCWDCVCCLW